MQDDTAPLRLPEGSCDCHFHIYGPFDRFPQQQEGRFTPSQVFSVEDAFAMWERTGATRGVIVHAVGSGEDNAVTFDAGKEHMSIFWQDAPDGCNIRLLGIDFDPRLRMVDSVTECITEACWRLRSLLRSRRFHIDIDHDFML